MWLWPLLPLLVDPVTMLEPAAATAAVAPIAAADVGLACITDGRRDPWGRKGSLAAKCAASTAAPLDAEPEDDNPDELPPVAVVEDPMGEACKSPPMTPAPPPPLLARRI